MLLKPRTSTTSKETLRVLSLATLLACPSFAFAQDPEELPEENWDGAPIVSFVGRTIFPLYVGAGLQLHASPQLRLGIDFGTTPKAYADAFGNMASQLAAKDSYKSTLQTAYRDSSLYRVYLRYAFTDEPTGFGIEFGLAQINGKGEQKVSDVAKATNLQNDFQGVSEALAAAGQRPYVTLESEMLTLDVLATYDFEIKSNVNVSLGGGFSRIIGAEVDMTTKVEQFDSSKLGIALQNLGETELADGLEKYGFTPILSAEVSYSF